jgi:hypothetical protein
MKRDEAKQIADHALEELRQALKAGRSETLLRFLDVMSRFHRYSWNNCILVIQKTATRIIESLQDAQPAAEEGHRHVA